MQESIKTALSTARDLLQSWTVGAYLRAYKAELRGNVLVLDTRDTVRGALDKLSHRGVLAAPVLDTMHARYWGWFGVRDAVAAFLTSDSDELLILRHQIGPEPTGVGPGEPLMRRSHEIRTTSEFSERQLGSLHPSSDGHMLFSADDPTFERLTLLDVVQGAMLHVGSGGWPVCHRVAVCEAVGTVLSVTNLISQTDICRFLLAHAHMLDACMTRSVSELGLVFAADTWQPKGVVCVSDSEPALDAFAAMIDAGVSALGVIHDDAGGTPDRSLVGNLSASDLKLVLPDRWGVLAQPVGRMLGLASDVAARHTAARHGRMSPRPRGVVAVLQESSLHDTLALLVGTGLHHVFVTGAWPHERVPLAVISTSDVLRALCVAKTGESS